MKRCFVIGVIAVLLFTFTACNTTPPSFESEINVIIAKETDTYATFSLDDYEEEIQRFSENNKLAPINSAKEAKAAALQLWAETFEERDLLTDSRAPRNAYFDAENDVWLIKDTLPDGTVGGCHYALIQTDGKVLAVWGTK